MTTAGLKELKRKYDFAEYLFKALIFFISNEGSGEIPADKSFMLFAISLGACEYASGKKFDFIFKNSRDDFDWYVEIKKKVADILGDVDSKSKLSRRLEEAFLWLTDTKITSDYVGFRRVSCPLFDFYQPIINKVHYSTFKVGNDFVINTKSKILPVFDKEEIECIKMIVAIAKSHIIEEE